MFYNCPVCDDDKPEPLGLLGIKAHFRCSACGIGYSQEIDVNDDIDIEFLNETLFS